MIWYRNIMRWCSEGIIEWKCVYCFWIYDCKRAWRLKNDFRDILKLFLNCEFRNAWDDKKCSLRQYMLHGSIYHSRELNSRLEVRMRAKGKSSFSLSLKSILKWSFWFFNISWRIWMRTRMRMIIFIYQHKI